jgi:phosphate transport system permease protein
MFYKLNQTLVLTLLIATMVGMFALLLHESLPAWQAFGWGFLWHSDWNPSTPVFGALSAILGTLISAFLAVLIATPISIIVSFTIQEYLPRRLKKIVRVIMDLCMGIPSIVYGIWGMIVLIPIMSTTLQPFLQEHCSNWPIIGVLFSGPTIGLGLLTAALVLTIMILPMMIALMTDLMSQIPPYTREAAYGVGCYKSELFKLYRKQIQRPLWGTTVLSLGRALGETMAVSFVLGNSHQFTLSLFMPATTLSASIANEFTEAIGTLYPESLFGLGFILLCMSLLVIVLARILLRKEGLS